MKWLKNQIQKEVPVYLLPVGPIVLDGDIFEFFSFTNLSSFRKFLKKNEDDIDDHYVFRLTAIDKFVLKYENPEISYLNTSAQTFAFTRDFFDEFFGERVNQLLGISKKGREEFVHYYR